LFSFLKPSRGTPEGEKFKELAARGDLVPDNLVVQLIIKTIKNRRSYVK
jgi:adenylate kinase family enzyme